MAARLQRNRVLGLTRFGKHFILPSTTVPVPTFTEGLSVHSYPCDHIYRGEKSKNKRQILYLNCWSLVLLVLARNLSANFSKFLE